VIIGLSTQHRTVALLLSQAGDEFWSQSFTVTTEASRFKRKLIYFTHIKSSALACASGRAKRL
jgi:hypothetical protein